jgi:hypothetical protein
MKTDNKMSQNKTAAPEKPFVGIKKVSEIQEDMHVDKQVDIRKDMQDVKKEIKMEDLQGEVKTEITAIIQENQDMPGGRKMAL